MRYIRLKNNFYDILEISDLLLSIEWQGLPEQKTLDGPVTIDDVPLSIQQAFDYEKIYSSAGFVKVSGNYNLPAHEDSFLEKDLQSYKGVVKDEYVDWLRNTGRRKCSLMIPVQGDFENTYTDLYWKDNNKKFASFSLNDGPVLFQTNGDVLHGVDNIGKNERITFQLSFGENYEYVANKIFALGLAEV